jgi:hypothetical protein
MWVLDGLRRPLDVESFRPEEVDPVELDFETLSAYLYYYGGTPAHYRAAAEKAIAAGVGDKALLALSIAPDLPLREQRVRYYRALRDSRWSACADNGRWVIVVRDIARRIIDGRIPDPYRGARLLYDQVVRAKSPDAVTWFRFLYAVEEQPDDPDPRSAILAEASRILQS